ncbi:SPRY domain-containing protein 3-like [Mytilus edulis]|uniref:SPRY domain-containing protein 3-like n=1 Tax=Mytilus edulis TaxID=6550 RepID=UPI0039F1349A
MSSKFKYGIKTVSYAHKECHIIAVDIRYQTMKKLVRLPNGLYEELSSYRSRISEENNLYSCCLRSENIHINGDNLSAISNNQVGLYIANCKLKSYFEVEIVALVKNSQIGVGLVHDKYFLHDHPGWRLGSIGFHADDGRIYIEDGRGFPYGPVWNVGDIIGCGATLKSPYRVDIFFTYNGKKIKRASLEMLLALKWLFCFKL